MRLAILAAAIAALVAAHDAHGAACEFSALRFVPCPQGRAASACVLVGDNETSDHVLLYSLAANDRLADEAPVSLASTDASQNARRRIGKDVRLPSVTKYCSASG